MHPEDFRLFVMPILWLEQTDNTLLIPSNKFASEIMLYNKANYYADKIFGYRITFQDVIFDAVSRARKSLNLDRDADGRWFYTPDVRLYPNGWLHRWIEDFPCVETRDVLPKPAIDYDNLNEYEQFKALKGIYPEGRLDEERALKQFKKYKRKQNKGKAPSLNVLIASIEAHKRDDWWWRYKTPPMLENWLRGEMWTSKPKTDAPK
jgi:hypothetical protein